MQRPSPSELKAVASIGELLARERRARLAAERRLVSMQAELLRANAALDAHARRLTEEIKPLRAEAEGLRGAAGRAADLARVAERRLWDALEATPDGFAIYDPALLLVTANAGYLGPYEGLDEMRPGIAYRRVLELAADEGIVDIGMMRPADWVASMVARLDEERPEPVVLRLWDGACVRMVHRRAASGDLVALAIDVTAALDREAELEEARWRAEAASRAKSAFLANMSHELRTPLGGILGMSQLLAEEALSEDQRMQLSIIQDSGEALLRIVDDVLDLGRIEGARLALRPAPFDLRASIEEVVRMHRPVAVEHGLALSADIDRGLPARLIGDGARVRQVLSNLVGNAVKFTPEGRVTIRAVGAGTPAPGMVRLHVSVEDTGIGIEEADLDRLWDAFEQAEADRDRRHDGAGLGLTVTRRLVAMMGGEIWADSAPGQGSCFGIRIDLPIARECRGEEAGGGTGGALGGGAWGGAGAGPGDGWSGPPGRAGETPPGRPPEGLGGTAGAGATQAARAASQDAAPPRGAGGGALGEGAPRDEDRDDARDRAPWGDGADGAPTRAAGVGDAPADEVAGEAGAHAPGVPGASAPSRDGRPADDGRAPPEAPRLGAPQSDPWAGAPDGDLWAAAEGEPPPDPAGARAAGGAGRRGDDGGHDGGHDGGREPATASPELVGGLGGQGPGEDGAPALAAPVLAAQADEAQAGRAPLRFGRGPREGEPDAAPPAASAAGVAAGAERRDPDEGGGVRRAPGREAEAAPEGGPSRPSAARDAQPPSPAWDAPSPGPSPGTMSDAGPFGAGREAASLGAARDRDASPPARNPLAGTPPDQPTPAVPGGAQGARPAAAAPGEEDRAFGASRVEGGERAVFGAPERSAEAPSTPPPPPERPEPPAMPLFSRRVGGALAPPAQDAPSAPKPAPAAPAPDALATAGRPASDAARASAAGAPPEPGAPTAPGPVPRARHDDAPAGAPALAPEPRDPAPPPGGGAPAGLRAMRVLAAEDNRANRLILQRMLAGLDIALAFAADGAEAVAAFARQRPDLILMDISMPGMDGREATRRIREAERAARAAPVPIVAMTAHALSGDEQAIRAAGLDGYIAKPLRKALILDAILAHAPPGARPPDGPAAE